MHTLTDREYKIIRLRFGVEEGYARTLNEVADVMKVSAERIANIEEKIVQKLLKGNRGTVIANDLLACSYN